MLPSTATAPGPRDSAEKNASLGTVDEGPRKRQRRHAKVSETRGPAHQQTRAGIVRKKNSTPYRTWRVRFADLRAEIGDHQFYKTATLTNPQNEQEEEVVVEGSQVRMFTDPQPRRIWGLGRAKTGRWLLLWTAPDDSSAPAACKSTELCNILDGEPMRPAGADEWLNRLREQAKARRAATRQLRSAPLTAAHRPARPAATTPVSMPCVEPDYGLRAALAQKDARIRELEQKVDQLMAEKSALEREARLEITELCYASFQRDATAYLWRAPAPHSVGSLRGLVSE